MTAHAERDPLPPEDRAPTAHRWAIEAALKATADAVRKSKDSRKKPASGGTGPTGRNPA